MVSSAGQKITDDLSKGTLSFSTDIFNCGPTGGVVCSVAGAIINFNGWRIASGAGDITVKRCARGLNRRGGRAGYARCGGVNGQGKDNLWAVTGVLGREDRTNLIRVGVGIGYCPVIIVIIHNQGNRENPCRSGCTGDLSVTRGKLETPGKVENGVGGVGIGYQRML